MVTRIYGRRVPPLLQIPAVSFEDNEGGGRRGEEERDLQHPRSREIKPNRET